MFAVTIDFEDRLRQLTTTMWRHCCMPTAAQQLAQELLSFYRHGVLWPLDLTEISPVSPEKNKRKLWKASMFLERYETLRNTQSKQGIGYHLCVCLILKWPLKVQSRIRTSQTNTLEVKLKGLQMYSTLIHALPSHWRQVCLWLRVRVDHQMATDATKTVRTDLPRSL